MRVASPKIIPHKPAKGRSQTIPVTASGKDDSKLSTPEKTQVSQNLPARQTRLTRATSANVTSKIATNDEKSVISEISEQQATYKNGDLVAFLDKDDAEAGK